MCIKLVRHWYKYRDISGDEDRRFMFLMKVIEKNTRFTELTRFTKILKASKIKKPASLLAFLFTGSSSWT